ATAGAPWRHGVRELETPLATSASYGRGRRPRCTTVPRGARVLEIGNVVETSGLAGAARERTLGLAWRVLALLGKHVIHERVLALVGRHTAPGRRLDIIISAPSRGRSTHGEPVAIGPLG